MKLHSDKLLGSAYLVIEFNLMFVQTSDSGSPYNSNRLFAYEKTRKSFNTSAAEKYIELHFKVEKNAPTIGKTDLNNFGFITKIGRDLEEVRELLIKDAIPNITIAFHQFLNSDYGLEFINKQQKL